MSKPHHSRCEKFVAPFDEITPSALAGPGVSRPTAATRDSGTPVSERMLVSASASASMAAAGPSSTRLGTSTMRSTRNWPAESSTVALFAVPPLSRPTTTHSSEAVPMGMHATESAALEVRQHGEDAPVVVVGRGQPELGEDARDVLADR